MFRRSKGSRQHVSDALQIAGGIGLTVAAWMVAVKLGVLVGSLLTIIAGVVVAS